MIRACRVVGNKGCNADVACNNFRKFAVKTNRICHCSLFHLKVLAMSVFFKSVFPFFSKKEKKKECTNVIKGVDPNEIWELISEIGDGTFGKVHKVGIYRFKRWLGYTVS